MKKNSLNAFASREVKIDLILGGYRYEPTTTSGGGGDEHLMTAKGELQVPVGGDGQVNPYNFELIDGTNQCVKTYVSRDTISVRSSTLSRSLLEA